MKFIGNKKGAKAKKNEDAGGHVSIVSQSSQTKSSLPRSRTESNTNNFEGLTYDAYKNPTPIQVSESEFQQHKDALIPQNIKENVDRTIADRPDPGKIAKRFLYFGVLIAFIMIALSIAECNTKDVTIGNPNKCGLDFNSDLDSPEAAIGFSLICILLLGFCHFFWSDTDQGICTGEVAQLYPPYSFHYCSSFWTLEMVITAFHFTFAIIALVINVDEKSGENDEQNKRLYIGAISVLMGCIILVHLYKLYYRSPKIFDHVVKFWLGTLVLIPLEDVSFLYLLIQWDVEAEPIFIILVVFSLTSILARIGAATNQLAFGNPVVEENKRSNVIIIKDKVFPKMDYIATIENRDQTNEKQTVYMKRLKEAEKYSFYYAGAVKVRPHRSPEWHRKVILAFSIVLVCFSLAAFVVVQLSPQNNSQLKAQIYQLVGIGAGFAAVLLASAFIYFCFGSNAHGRLAPHTDILQVDMNPPEFVTRRALEVADYITDIVTVVLQFGEVDTAFRVLMIFSLVSSTMINVYEVWWSRKFEHKQTFKSRRIPFVISLGLLACEDVIMIPINVLLLLKDRSSEGETASILDSSEVLVSLIMGLWLGALRFWNAFRFVFCGHPVYEGNLEVIREFLEWEEKKPRADRAPSRIPALNSGQNTLPKSSAASVASGHTTNPRNTPTPQAPPSPKIPQVPRTPKSGIKTRADFKLDF